MQIVRALLTRLITTLITLLGAAIIVFVVIRVVPGNPIAMMLPPGATDADIDRLKALYGLDKSIFEQFVIWISNVIQGDFGTSITLRQPVYDLVIGRLPATLELSVMALLIAVIIGGAAALTATLYRGSKVEGGIDVAGGIALSLPDFLWGLALILLFGVLWPLFHISGRISPSLGFEFSSNFYLFEALARFRFDVVLDLMGHMLMPALALAIPLAAIILQLLKQSLKECMHDDYITLARTKGYSESSIILRDALPNAILPTLTLIGVQFTFLIGGTVIIERLFSYEGLGNMAIDAVINRDLPLIQGIVLIFALLFTMVNLVVDMAYAALNPSCAMRDARGHIRRLPGIRLWLSGGWLTFLVLAAVFAPLISPHDPLAQDLFAGRLPPFFEQGADPAYLLGTDSLGRDLLSRMLYGARLALIVALVAGTLTCLIGATLGLIAGYYRGWADLVISRFIDIWMAFPPVLFAILLIAVLGTGLMSVIIAIVVIDWTALRASSGPKR